MFYLLEIPAISIKPDVLFTLGPVEITATMAGLLVVDLVLIAFALWVRKGLGIIPSRIQVFFEALMGFYLEKLTLAFGGDEKKARSILPVLLSICMMLLLCNNFGVIPLVSQLTLNAGEGAMALTKTPPTHYSLTIGLAFTVIGLAHFLAFKINPIGHIGNFIKIGSFFKIRKPMDVITAFIDLFLGFLDFVGEFAKVISLSSRLFGNILAGELIVIIITFLSSYTTFLVPIPFMFLGMASSVIQAFVFPLLALQFMTGTITSVSPRRKQQA